MSKRDEIVVEVRHATQCEFIPMTPVPDSWRGKRVRFVVEDLLTFHGIPIKFDVTCPHCGKVLPKEET
jgi:hypothetical protein